MQGQIQPLSKGKVLEDYVANNLPRLLPGLKLINQKDQVVGNSTFDIHAQDSKGIDYYIEVKASKCNRLSVGQIVEYKSNLSKVNPKAKVFLICEDINPELKNTLKKIDINILTFADLNLPQNLLNYQASRNNVMRLTAMEQTAYFALLKRGHIIARAEDLALALGVSNVWAKNILSKLANHGAAQRVGKGKYVIIPADVLYGRKSYVADPLVLVSELMKPSDYYIAYYSAAHIHGIAEQMPFKTTVAVLKQLRPIKIGNININFVNLKESRFFGYEEIKYMGINLKVSDIEKTIVDCFDRQDLSSGIAEVVRVLSNAVSSEKLDWQKLVLYVTRFKNHALAQRMGFIIELLMERKKIQVQQEILNELLSLSSSKVYSLDVKSPIQGEISRKWRIINNAGLFEI
jgi:predicted transcriptional regulator of viral defense system